MEQLCLQCESQLKGRIDKKFCSPECRNEFNNARYRVKNAEVVRINKVLKKNWEILLKLNPTDIKTVSKKRLLSEGFDFEYFTSQYFAKKSNRLYFFCYDQGYWMDETTERVLLVIKQAYVDKEF